MTDSYTPQRGSVPDRIVNWLRRQPAGETFTQGAAAEIAGVPGAALPAYLRPAITHGLVIEEKRDGIRFYSLASGERISRPFAANGSHVAVPRAPDNVPPEEPSIPVFREQAADLPPELVEQLSPKAQRAIAEEKVNPPFPEPQRPATPSVPDGMLDVTTLADEKRVLIPALETPQPPAPEPAVAEEPAPAAATPFEPAVAEPGPLRAALWSDGQLAIEAQGVKLVLGAEDTRKLFKYLAGLIEAALELEGAQA